MINRYLIPLFLMLLSAAIYVIWVDAPYKDIATLREKAKVIESYIADADSAQAKLDNITEQFNAFPPDGDRRLQVLLPEKIDTVRLIIDMNEIAMRHGVTIDSPLSGRAAQDDAEPKDYTLYHLGFKTTATYKVFREFLADIERSLALRDITSVTFSSTDSAVGSDGTEAPEFSVFSFGINISSYGLH